MSSLSFVPHSLKKRPKTSASTALASFTGSSTFAPTSILDRNAELSTPIDDEPAVLLSLALSDFALAADPALRDPNHDGYIVLNNLLHAATAFAGVDPLPTEATIIKSLRAHANDRFDVRMILAGVASRSARHGRLDAGGYEVRRKDWQEVVQHMKDGTLTRTHWQKRTIYIENIPLSSRTMGGITRLVASLLSSDSGPSNTNTKYEEVQHIHFPPHYQDDLNRQGANAQKCKGFALVTLSTVESVDKLVREWPWEGASERTASRADSSDPVIKEASESMLRVLTKARWDALQDEYVSYRDKLLAEIASKAETAPAVPGPSSSRITHPKATTSNQQAFNHEHQPARRETSKPTGPPPLPHEPELSATISPSSPFPPRCLVFVRNIHPETNKTTLKTIFGTAFANNGTEGKQAATEGIDYVDFTKGLDTCHLRLATPSHAQTFVAHFTSSSGSGLYIQHDPVESTLSDVASPEDTKPTRRPLTMELVTGRPEALYWERVPEKVRRGAVMRAIALSGDDGTEGKGGMDGNVGRDVSKDEGRGRKRRRNK